MSVYEKTADQFATSFQTMARNAATAVWYGKWEQAEMLLTKMLAAIQQKQGKKA